MTISYHLIRYCNILLRGCHLPFSVLVSAEQSVILYKSEHIIALFPLHWVETVVLTTLFKILYFWWAYLQDFPLVSLLLTPSSHILTSLLLLKHGREAPNFEYFPLFPLSEMLFSQIPPNFQRVLAQILPPYLGLPWSLFSFP